MAVRLTDKVLPLNDAFVGMVDAAQIVETPAGFKDEDNMASDSATAFCSQQSIKKYVDDSVHTQNTDTALGSGAVAADHGTAATDQIINVSYGTSATPPTASTTTEGSIYIQYTA